MNRIVLIIFVTLSGMILTSCNPNSEMKGDEVITLSDGTALNLENLHWLKTLIDLSKTDKTGNCIGCIWLESYNGQDIFVTNMGLGSGGVLY